MSLRGMEPQTLVWKYNAQSAFAPINRSFVHTPLLLFTICQGILQIKTAVAKCSLHIKFCTGVDSEIKQNSIFKDDLMEVREMKNMRMPNNFKFGTKLLTYIIYSGWTETDAGM